MRMLLKERISHELEWFKKIEAWLNFHPDDWDQFQEEFNQRYNRILFEIMQAEQEGYINSSNHCKFKRFFEKRLRKFLGRGEFIPWSLNKPFGYAGDYKIIEDIYNNSPATVGLERLYDNYFQVTPATIATRIRKDDFQEIILDYVKCHPDDKLLIMDLASGPGRLEKEFFEKYPETRQRVHFDCYDHDERAHRYAKNLLNGCHNNVSFFKKDVVRLALAKNIFATIPRFYNLIISAGLFDYLSDGIAIRLIKNLKYLLRAGGIMVVSNYREKKHNPSVCFMEWLGEWHLQYRSEIDFKSLFLASGFQENELSSVIQKIGVMQYCIARVPTMTL